MNITITLTGTTPLLMHNPRMVDPEYEITRAIKELTTKKKKTDADLKQIARLEWYGGLYEENGIVIQPSSKVRKCLVETARLSKLGKAIERAIIMAELFVPLTHDGPKDIDAMFAESRFHSRLSVGVNQKRVMRVRPQFYPWGLTLKGMFVEDAGLNFHELENIVQMAGIVTGIGDNRVNGYGRFNGKVVAR